MMKRVFLLSLMAVGATSMATVFPTGPHAAYNFIPFGAGGGGGIPTMHQVFDAGLFSAATGGVPANITGIGFAPGITGTFNLGQVTINLGYTNAIPGVGSALGGLATPLQGGGGGPNAIGAMSTFYSNAATSFTFTTIATSNFQMGFAGAFVYDPNQGNLLVEIVVPNNANTTLTVSRTAGSSESSRAYDGTRFTNGESPATATRMDFRFTPVPEPATMLVLGSGALALLRRRRKTA